MLLWNVLTMIIWCWLMGSFSAANVVGGFILGFIIIWLLNRTKIIHDKGYVKQVPRIISLVVFFLYELVISNLRLAADLFKPNMKLSPSILAMPLDAKTDAEITVVASLITLTPGTLSMEVSEDKSTLFIHAMHVKDEEQAIKELKQGFERRVLEVLR